MRATRIVAPRTIISALLLLIALGAGVVWQAQGRAHQQIDIGTAADDGAALNFHAGHLPTAPPAMQRYGLEWLFRLSKEPKRLWRRYLLVNPLYLGLFALQATGLYTMHREAMRPNVKA